MKLYIIKFAASPSAGRLEHVLDRAVSSLDIPVVTEYITSTEQFSDLADKGKLQNSRLIFAVETDISGINPEACKLLHYLRLKSIYPAAPCGDLPSVTAAAVNGRRDGAFSSGTADISSSGYGVLPDTENLIFSGAAGGIIVDGQCDLFTKDLGRRLAFTANLAGCNFPGKPLSEATSDLRNFRVSRQGSGKQIVMRPMSGHVLFSCKRCSTFGFLYRIIRRSLRYMPATAGLPTALPFGR